MKKMMTVLMTLVMCLTLVACGGVDKQPAIDAFNNASTKFDALADKMNAEITSYPQELVDIMNEMAAAMAEHKEILEGDQELTEEQIAEMIAAFAEVEQWATETDAELDSLKITDDHKQAVIEVFNKTSTAFDQLANKMNANIDKYSQDAINIMTQMANALNQCKTLLEGNQEITEEDANLLMSQLKDIENWVAEAEKAVAEGVFDLMPGGEEAGNVDMQAAVEAFNAIAPMFDATATAVNANIDAFSDEFVNTLVELSGVMSEYKAILESDYEPTVEEYNAMMEDLSVIGQWLLEIESQVFG